MSKARFKELSFMSSANAARRDFVILIFLFVSAYSYVNSYISRTNKIFSLRPGTYYFRAVPMEIQ